MFSKNYFLVFIITFFVAGFIFLSLPEKGFSGMPMLGCCINMGGNCSGGGGCSGAGNEPCQVLGPLGMGSCPNECTEPDEVACFTTAEVCVSTSDEDFCLPGCCVVNTGEGECKITDSEEDCEEFGMVEVRDDCDQLPDCDEPPIGCCVVGPGECRPDETSDECAGELDFDDPSCDTIDECNVLGCCQTGLDMCVANQMRADCTDGMGTDWTPGAFCDRSTGLCGDVALGCCSAPQPEGPPICVSGDQAVSEEDCDTRADSTWVVGGSCNDAGTCGPIGCCQIALQPTAECANTNVGDCGDMGGAWVEGGGPDNNCITGESPNVGLCPRNLTGCCVFGPDDCGQLTPDDCESVGDFTEIGVDCSEVAECNIPPKPPIVISPIPTIGQWGLIAMAGLLGLFSLFIMIRRHRYNVG